MITLFGKLKEHEHEITRFKSSEAEIKLKDKKLVVLKVSSSKESSYIIGECDSGGESPNEENMVLFVKRFNRYIKKHGLRRSVKTPQALESRKLKEKLAKMKMVIFLYFLFAKYVIYFLYLPLKMFCE